VKLLSSSIMLCDNISIAHNHHTNNHPSLNQQWGGNLLVWPKSHILVHKCLVGVHGAIDLNRLARLADDPEYERVENSLSLSSISSTQDNDNGNDRDNSDNSERGKSNNDQHQNEPDNLPALGLPVHMMAKRGDVFLLHPDLAHTGI